MIGQTTERSGELWFAVVVFVVFVVATGIHVGAREPEGKKPPAAATVLVQSDTQNTAKPAISPSARQTIDMERLEREAAGERKATGPWKQIVAIESYHRVAVLSGTKEGRDRPGNENVFAFLDARRFALADGRHPIRVFSVADGKLIRAFGEPEKDGNLPPQMAVSADGRLLVLTPDSAPTIWDTTTGKPVCILPASNDRFAYWYAGFLSKGKVLVTSGLYKAERGYYCGRLQAWELDETTHKATVTSTFDLEESGFARTVIDPYIVVPLGFKSLIVRAAGAKGLQRVGSPVDGKCELLESRPDGTGHWFCSDFRTPSVREISLPDGKEVRKTSFDVEAPEGEQYGQRLIRYALSPRRTTIAILQDGRVSFFDFQSGKEISSIRASSRFEMLRVDFLSEDRALLTGDRRSETIDEIRIASGKELSAIPDGVLTSPLASPDGASILVRRVVAAQVPGMLGYYALPRPYVVLWTRTDRGTDRSPFENR